MEFNSTSNMNINDSYEAIENHKTNFVYICSDGMF